MSTVNQVYTSLTSFLGEPDWPGNILEKKGINCFFQTLY